MKMAYDYASSPAAERAGGFINEKSFISQRGARRSVVFPLGGRAASPTRFFHWPELPEGTPKQVSNSICLFVK